VPYLSKSYAPNIKKKLQDLKKLSKNYNKNILLLHQSIDRYLPYDPEISMGDLPVNFNYYAFGHIHERIIDDFGKGMLAYPGSTEVWRVDELDGYKKNGKGFFLVDFDSDIPDIHKVDVKLPREILKKRITYSELNDELINLQKYLSGLSKKPILHLSIEGGNFDRSDVYDQVNDFLSDLCLALRPNYKPDELEDQDLILNSTEGLNFREIVKERLSGFEDDKISVLALNILDETSAGNMERAQEIIDKFYEGYYDH
jgi:DNA repair exonuclease SbcCD nuclease subunit